MPLLTLFFFSCKKSPADGGPYTFHNKMREPLNLSLYKTQDDYTHSRNVLLSIRIPAQSNYTWRYTGGDGVFDKDALLYLDWHTDDYTHTNWYIFDSAKNTASYKEAPLFKFTRRRFGLNEYRIDGSDKSYMRPVLLQGNNAASMWRACDALEYNNNTSESIWNKLNTTEKNVTLTIRKDLSYLLQLGNETAQGNELYFSKRSGGTQSVSIPVTTSTPSGRQLSGELYCAGRNVITPVSTDTLVLRITNGYSYILTR